jgi:hypothetical protein
MHLTDPPACRDGEEMNAAKVDIALDFDDFSRAVIR